MARPATKPAAHAVSRKTQGQGCFWRRWGEGSCNGRGNGSGATQGQPRSPDGAQSRGHRVTAVIVTPLGLHPPCMTSPVTSSHRDCRTADGLLAAGADTKGLARPGSVDALSPTCHPTQAMETWQDRVAGTAGYWELRALGANPAVARRVAANSRRGWCNSGMLLNAVLTLEWSDKLGVPRLSEPHPLEPPSAGPHTGWCGRRAIIMIAPYVDLYPH